MNTEGEVAIIAGNGDERRLIFAVMVMLLFASCDSDYYPERLKYVENKWGHSNPSLLKIISLIQYIILCELWVFDDIKITFFYVNKHVIIYRRPLS